MSLRAISVRARNLLGFGLLGLILLTTGLVALKQINVLRQDVLDIRDGWMEGLDAMGQIKAARLNMRLQESLALTMPDQLDLFAEEIERFKGLVQQVDRQYEATITAEEVEDRRLFNRYQEFSRAYEQALQAVVVSLRSGSPDLASVGASLQAYNSMIAGLDELIVHNRQGAQRAGEEAEDSANQAQWTFAVLLLVGLILTLLTAWLLSQSVTAPLNQLKAVAARIAGGDLSQDVRVHGADEITEVQQSLQQMQVALRDTLLGIQGSATQLASAADEMHAITEQTSQGIHRQNDEIQMAATAVTEMSAAVDEVARNANHTSDSSREAEQTALTGRRQVSVTRDTIEQLTGKLDNTSTTISRLAEEAIGIGKVLEVIRTIAEQTNLLALNAAIEAARAGDQGRGFAVVADEVRALAQRTQSSTQEIERMISAIQSASQESVSAMQQSSEFAGRSQQLASEADEALALIAQRISQINEMNLVIASAAEQQAQVAREVDRNLVAIRDISEQSSSGAQQTSAASDQLARLATQLNQMVGRFRL
ncbi:methyl-accepting chemotaxis protein [Pseudomonas fluvialis]|uniref:Chemotaxis transducer n=1 Tax=Pseudomonas fluvialis TaxID=1793966 RepID=A0A2I0CPN2_9PSED|nr:MULTISPECIES: methyl-accepting chemotaxis protein [Pseudomonas]MBP8262365.1 methyl-accepting chemotaxis protein [Pseudomonas sp.]OXM39922.1 methyl-accepting chemotaxis protein [Pseudomonas fluvialis]PKF71111.1 methyl-accepting chemotaxis protein [Pseudomonas pharmacofabricae]GGH90881.1 chemotaxis transducer [Pseudomonas fluvialis]